MSRLSDIARNTVGGGGLTGGLEKIKIDEIIAAYPDGVSITGVDIIGYNGDHFPVFTFAEDASRYFSGGKALKDMADAWVENYDGDIREVNADLQREHVRIKLEKVTTKAKRTFTRVTILGTVKAAIDVETGEILNEANPF